MQPYITYLDMDGVIVDWLDAALKLVDVDTEDVRVQNAIIKDYDAIDKLVGRNVVDAAIIEVGSDFWANLEFLPWGQELIAKISEAAPGQLAFLSSPGKWPDGCKGKAIWQQKHYPDIPLILCRKKQWVASSNKYLVDDDPKQIDSFREMNGFAYKWPCQYSLKKEPEAVHQSIVNVLLGVELMKNHYGKR